MSDPGPAAALSRCRAELAAVHDAIRARALDAGGLHEAVQELANLTETMAGLAGELALRTEADLLPGSPNGSAPRAPMVGEIAADLRTMAKHLTTAKLLLEPAIADLGHLRTGTAKSTAVLTRS